MIKSFQNRIITFLMLTLLVLGCQNKQTKPLEETPPNVLFIISDDLNDWLGCMGHPLAKTPNIDKLAEDGVLFTNAQCSAPLCSPSRASFMTGLHTFNNGVYINQQKSVGKEYMTIPAFFKSKGYYVAGGGKLFHGKHHSTYDIMDAIGPGIGLSGGPFVDGELNSDLQNPTHLVDRGPGKLKAVLPLNKMPNDRPKNRYNTFDWGPVDVTDEDMPDGKIANWTVEQIKKEHDKPFFIATGFFRPHQPLFAPRKYHEMYNIEDMVLPDTPKNDLEDLSQTGKDFALLAGTSGIHKTVVEHNQWKNAIASYLACVSFVDAQIGKIMKALEESGKANNTIIVLFSDHGWHLGEKEHWGKWTGWQRAQRVPLIVAPPKSNAVKGQEHQGMVSLLDLFPTLAELSGNEIPSGLDGSSLVPIIQNPKRKTDRTVLSTFGPGNNVVMTEKWRYLHYFDGTEELYNIEKDPNELQNLVYLEDYEQVRTELRKQLPEYPDVAHFVRMDNWKAIIYVDGRQDKLYDIYGHQGIMEKFDKAKEHPDILNKIKTYLKENNVDKKFVNIKNI